MVKDFIWYQAIAFSLVELVKRGETGHFLKGDKI